MTDSNNLGRAVAALALVVATFLMVLTGTCEDPSSYSGLFEASKALAFFSFGYLLAPSN